jgi:hypothetical protein
MSQRPDRLGGLPAGVGCAPLPAFQRRPALAAVGSPRPGPAGVSAGWGRARTSRCRSRGFVDRCDQQPNFDREQFDFEQVHAEVPGDDDALVAHPLQDVGQVGRLLPMLDGLPPRPGSGRPPRSSTVLPLQLAPRLAPCPLVGDQVTMVVEPHVVDGEDVGGVGNPGYLDDLDPDPPAAVAALKGGHALRCMSGGVLGWRRAALGPFSSRRRRCAESGARLLPAEVLGG